MVIYLCCYKETDSFKTKTVPRYRQFKLETDQCRDSRKTEVVPRLEYQDIENTKTATVPEERQYQDKVSAKIEAQNGCLSLSVLKQGQFEGRDSTKTWTVSKQRMYENGNDVKTEAVPWTETALKDTDSCKTQYRDGNCTKIETVKIETIQKQF